MKKFIRVLMIGSLVVLLITGASVIFLHFDETNRTVLSADVKADRIIIHKLQHEMDIYSNNRLIRSYIVALGRGGMSAKLYRGDNKTPEGIYKVDLHNLHSAFHRALHVSYPNSADVARAHEQGKDPGGDIMIHGIRNGLGWIGSLHRLVDWTAGCIAVTDKEIDEIWALVPDGTVVEITP